MNYRALWIDHQHAFLYTFTLDGVSEEKIEAVANNHHNHHPKDARDTETTKFFHMITDRLNQTQELVVMGPGTAKSEFKHHCEDHHKNLAKVIIAVETMDSHPTQNEMLARAKKVFKSHHLWTKL